MTRGVIVFVLARTCGNVGLYPEEEGLSMRPNILVGKRQPESADASLRFDLLDPGGDAAVDLQHERSVG